MPIDVTITITGLCLCFRKEHPPSGSTEPVWNIIFPCDDKHDLSFSFPTPDQRPAPPPIPQSPMRLHEKVRDLSMEFISRVTSPQSADYDVTFGDLLNLADPDLHGIEPDGRHCKLRLDRKPNHDTDQVWMRVPRSTLHVDSPAKTYHSWLWEITDVVGGVITPKPGTEPFFKWPKAVGLSLTFRCEAPLRVTVGDRNGTTFNETFSQPNLRFHLDNTCSVPESPNDFVNIYESVLDGPQQPGKRFVTGKLPFGSFRVLEGKSKEMLETVDLTKEIKEEIKKTITTAAANCDPVGSEPPPGP